MLTRPHGFNLIELMVALAVSTTLLISGVPAWQQLRLRSATAAAANALTASLSQARLAAIHSRQPTVLCPVTPESTACRSDGDWSAGWMLFTDPNLNNQLDQGESVLQRNEDVGSLAILSGRSRPRVRYQPNGTSRGGNLTIRLCADGAAQSAIVVNNAGRPRSERDPEKLSELPCP